MQGGRKGLILTVDTKDVSTLGHFTTYPSQNSTVYVQLPLENSMIPMHTVVHTGPCLYEEQSY